VDGEPKLRLSRRLFALNILGAVLAALGMLGYTGVIFAGLPSWTAILISTILLVVGLGLMAWFMFDLVKRIRTLNRERAHSLNR